MRVSRVTTAVALFVGLVGFASSADAQQCPKGKLRLYTSWPMQGAMLPEGTGMKNGVDLSVSEAGGAVAGFCLEVVNLDDASPQTGKWDGAVEAENANKAVGDSLAIVYIGTYNSGAAKVSIPITNRAHMAQVTPANTYPGLTKKRGAAPGEPEIYRPGGFVSYFRPIPADDIQGAVAAKWAKRLGVKKVFILNDQELYGKGIADVFEATAKKIGLPVVANEGIDWKQPDQKPILTKVRASGADLVYMGGVIETGAQVIIRQMKEAGSSRRGRASWGRTGSSRRSSSKARRATRPSEPTCGSPSPACRSKRCAVSVPGPRNLQVEVGQGADLVRAVRGRGHAGHHRRHQAGRARRSRRRRTSPRSARPYERRSPPPRNSRASTASGASTRTATSTTTRCRASRP